MVTVNLPIVVRLSEDQMRDLAEHYAANVAEHYSVCDTGFTDTRENRYYSKSNEPVRWAWMMLAKALKENPPTPKLDIS